MISNLDKRSYLTGCCLLGGLLLAAWLAPAAHGEGWPYWPFNKEDKPGTPDKIVTLWSDTILTQTGRPPVRGFGGRLMFYEGKKEEPIKVDGTLVVYAFDETDREANNTRPDRKYVFTPQQIPQHYSKSKVGHSYSVWIPWDEAGGMQKEITLIVRFQPKEVKDGKEAPVAISDPCRQLLPGRVAPAKLPTGGVLIPFSQLGPAPTASGMVGSPLMASGVQPAAYQAPINDGSGVVQAVWQQRRLTTSTIDVPSGSSIRSTLTSPQAAPTGGYYPASPGSMPAPSPNYAGQYYAGQNSALQNYPPQNSALQNYPPQFYSPQNHPAQGYPAQNYSPRNYPPQNSSPAGSVPPAGYGPPAASPAAAPGLQLRSGFAPARQWPLGEPLARLNRDRAPLQPLPAGSPSGLASPLAQGPANAAPAGPQGAPRYSN